MEETNLEAKKHHEGLFAKVEGTPAHILIVLGLALILLAPLILNFKGAGLASSIAEFEQIKAQKELDFEEVQRDQANRRKKSPEVLKHEEAKKQREEEKRTSSPFDPFLSPEQRDAMVKQEQEKDKAVEELKKAVDEKDAERAKALEEMKEGLEQKYDTIPIRREMAEAQTAVAGTRSHLVLGWMGNLLLIVGLLVLMLQSEGLRQKIILIVLLVVMFSALSGVNLDFLAQGRMGGSSTIPSRTTDRAPETPPPSKQ
ncbi:MAG: hypothetical protein L0229_13630 [Blastocatellia bacterium]|nr:hypothetical protein [Blastocatellia bacterium]